MIHPSFLYFVIVKSHLKRVIPKGGDNLPQKALDHVAGLKKGGVATKIEGPFCFFSFKKVDFQGVLANKQVKQIPSDMREKLLRGELRKMPSGSK